MLPCACDPPSLIHFQLPTSIRVLKPPPYSQSVHENIRSVIKYLIWRILRPFETLCNRPSLCWFTLSSRVYYLQFAWITYELCWMLCSNCDASRIIILSIIQLAVPRGGLSHANINIPEVQFCLTVIVRNSCNPWPLSVRVSSPWIPNQCIFNIHRQGVMRWDGGRL